MNPTETGARPSFDLVVCGGGVLGRAIALEAARSGRSVALIYPSAGDADSASLAAGAMIDTFGELSHHETADDFEAVHIAMGRRAQRVYPGWVDRLEREGGRSVFMRQGMFLVGNLAEEDHTMLRRIEAEMKAHDEPYERVDPRDVPGLSTNHRYRVFDALFMPSALSVDSGDLLSALRAAFLAQPSATLLDDAVERVERRGGRWMVSTRRGGPIEGEAVVVAAGAWTLRALGDETRRALDDVPELLCGKGISVLVRPTEPLATTIRTPNRCGACGLHAVPRRDGAVYLGASNGLHFDPDLARDQGIEIGRLADLIRPCSQEINTAFKNAALIAPRYGLRPIAADGQPLIGQTRLPGLYLATGTYRVGIHLAPVIAESIVAELDGRPLPVPHPFAPRGRAVQPGRSRITAVRGYLNHVLHEGATLYDRDVEMQNVLQTLFDMALFGEHGEERRELRRLLDSVSHLDEAIGEHIYHRLASRRAR